MNCFFTKTEIRKSTTIYTRVSNKEISKIRSPLASLRLQMAQPKEQRMPLSDT
jgi:hypothetical protein